MLSISSYVYEYLISVYLIEMILDCWIVELLSLSYIFYICDLISCWFTVLSKMHSIILFL